jgi:hypothetical protein
LGNPAGFGLSDALIFSLAVLLVFSVLAWTCLERPVRRLAEKTGWCLLLLAALPVILRLALLGSHPVPTPNTADDFSYLLLGDTFAHFRFANPAHPLHQFFEAVFVLQEPRYSSMFPPGQGIALALGKLVLGQPWAGVVLSVAAFCALAYWMLRAWVPPLWALIGALLAIAEFGPLSQWMNSYWGGALSASAGCLVFGSLPRLRADPRPRYAALLGLGLGLQMLARPFELALLALCVLVFFARWPAREWRSLAKILAVAALAALPAVAILLLHNHAVTGNFATLPYQLARYQYGVPTTFTTQLNPAAHRPLTEEQEVNYQAQRLAHGEGRDTFQRYFSRLVYRLRFYRFFFYAPLYLALPFFFFSLGEFRFVWALLSVVVFVLGSNFYPYFHPHYIAALTSVFLLASITGLRQLSRWRVSREIARLILFLCAAQSLFWYSVHLSGNLQLLDTLGRYETWNYINWGDYDGRIGINHRLVQAPGKQLVFVQYWPRHLFDEWIHNAADIDAAQVVFADDLGAAQNEKLRRYYPDRTAWLLEPDARPPRLTPYPAEQPEQPKPAQPPKAGPTRIDPKLFQNVR